ncbi:MAG: hypothetical protein HDR19_02880 [Lachnospiraceae bacterium]|nr:hypothetical protein [Lachnospiraceae bacterium]
MTLQRDDCCNQKEAEIKDNMKQINDKLSGRSEKMTLLEKYQRFLVNHTKPGIEPKSLDLSAEGWKLLIRENLTPLIEEKLQMRQIDDYIWASEYADGRRKVLSLFKINDAFATFQWGWNFDFVPRITSGNRIVWARTDKSVYTHIFELSEDFSGYAVPKKEKKNHSFKSLFVVRNKKQNARDMTIISRYGIVIKNLEKALNERIKQHKSVFLHLLPLIMEYYEATATYEEILIRIEQDMQINYYRLINSDSMIVYPFIEKHMGMREKALRDFEAISFADEKIKAKLFDYLIRLGED